MSGWRKSLSKGLMFGALTLPTLLCALPVFGPSICPRPRYVALYIAPFALGLLLWCRRRLLDSWGPLDARLAVDIVAVGCSALRLIGPIIPPSGHMLFFVFTLLTTSTLRYRVVALVLIAETTYIKLIVWQDRASWAYGVLAGLALGTVYFALPGRSRFRGDAPAAEARAAPDPAT
jgi:hypothetical protein